MATKILNIEQDDGFDDIVEFLRKEENEFVLIVPKSHKVFKDKFLIDSLKEESDGLGKSVTVVSNDENIIEKVSGAGFQVVGKRKKIKKTSALSASSNKKKGVLIKHPPHPINHSVKPKPLVNQQPENFDTESSNNIQDIIENNKDEEIEIEVKAKKEPEQNIKIHQMDMEQENGEGDKTSAISDFYKRPSKTFHTPSLPRPERKYIPKRALKTTVIILTLFAGVGTIFLFSTLMSKAKVTVNAQKEPFVIEIQVTVSEDIKDLDSELGLLPGKAVKIERVLSENFESTGEGLTETKAKGKLTVFNEFSSSSQVLVATTRFETSDGLVFRTPKTVTIPGAKLESGELIPGKLEIEVIADSAGEKYNIEPSDFTIPGFKGSPKFEKFYAKSDQPLTDGFKGKSKVATEDDINKAKRELNDEMNEFLKTEMHKLLLDDTVVFTPQLMNIDTSFSDKSNKAGQPGEKFTMIIYGKASTMFFKKDDALKLVEDKIKTKNSALGLKGNIEINYDNLTFSNVKKEISGKLSAEGNAFYSLDEDLILADIVGVSGGKIKDYFSKKAEVEFTKVIISPFWKSSIPKDKNKIELNIIYE